MRMSRGAELKRYRTYIQASGLTHPTFDTERYYTEMSTEEMAALRDKTVRDLERNPDFATRFYTEFVEYLNRKLVERKTFRDWVWRNTVLKFDLFVWKLKNERIY
jgi:hypothetical protein